MESPTRRRLSGMLVAGGLVAILLGGFRSDTQSGAFALLGGSPKINSSFWTDHDNGLSTTLKVRQFQPDGKPILNYEIDMQRLMHLVVIRDDFATFAHLHPSFDATTGTFWQLFTKEPKHRYYVYADTTPRGVGQQVFHFTLDSDGAVTTSPLVGDAPDASTTAGPYAVTLGSATLAADRPQSLSLTIFKDGKPAGDLGTYLGAAAHAVFINTRTLTYVHVHPTARGAPSEMHMGSGAEMNMSGNAMAGPSMTMSLPGLPAGLYKLWIQFRGAGGRVYTAPFTLLAR
ncbi:MAG: hypothetical protein WB609_14755 [Candidatus Cybelea sp.]